jgi:hypothetical protein
MGRIHQEWFCTVSGGGCGGYILCKINCAINGVVEMVCPKCGHKHQRSIKDGVITEQSRHTTSPTQEICPTMAAWSEKPRLQASQNIKGTNKEREGILVSQTDFIQELKSERFGFR